MPDIDFPTPTADVVFVNGPVITVNATDDVAEALAIKGGRILRVGSRAEVEQTVSRDTRLVDLGGRALIPGMTESHLDMSNSPQRSWGACTSSACPSVA